MRSLMLFQNVRPFVNTSSHRIVLLVLTSVPVMLVPASGLARGPSVPRHESSQ
jgi:hypothetical protein